MEPKDIWIPFQEIDWDCVKNNRFNVDTRDFHSGYLFIRESHPDYDTLIKYKDRFFFTKEELIAVINNLYTESGGEKEWRCLNLISEDKKVLNWRLKYLRIWRTEKGFLICNSDNLALSKELLSSPINKEHL